MNASSQTRIDVVKHAQSVLYTFCDWLRRRHDRATIYTYHVQHLINKLELIAAYICVIWNTFGYPVLLLVP